MGLKCAPASTTPESVQATTTLTRKIPALVRQLSPLKNDICKCLISLQNEYKVQLRSVELSQDFHRGGFSKEAIPAWPIPTRRDVCNRF